MSPILRLMRLAPRASRLAICRPSTSTPALSRSYASGDYGSGTGDPKGENPKEQGTSPATTELEHPGPPAPDVGQGSSGSTPTKEGPGKGDSTYTPDHAGNNPAAKQGGGTGTPASGARSYSTSTAFASARRAFSTSTSVAKSEGGSAGIGEKAGEATPSSSQSSTTDENKSGASRKEQNEKVNTETKSGSPRLSGKAPDETEDVKRHNEDVKKRSKVQQNGKEDGGSQGNDKVGKGFWSGKLFLSELLFDAINLLMCCVGQGGADRQP